MLPLRQLRQHERLQLRPVTASLPVSSITGADRDAFWAHCRNALGIARLLVQEGRAIGLVDTACYLTVDSACRAGLAQAGRAYDGDPARALVSLAAPRELWPPPERPSSAHERLRLTERVVAWIAAYLRSEAPEHRWGY